MIKNTFSTTDGNSIVSIDHVKNMTVLKRLPNKQILEDLKC